jgi:hypothetical protein
MTAPKFVAVRFAVWCLHVDVWGNAEEGYVVNDRRQVGHVDIMCKVNHHEATSLGSARFDAWPADAQVIRAMRRAGHLQIAPSKLRVDGDETSFWLETAEDAYPLFYLEQVTFSGYAYEFQGQRNWRTSSDEVWTIVVTDIATAPIGERTIDGVVCTVHRQHDGTIVAVKKGMFQ